MRRCPYSVRVLLPAAAGAVAVLDIEPELPIRWGEAAGSRCAASTAAWQVHADLVRRALGRGFSQGWDLHRGSAPDPVPGAPFPVDPQALRGRAGLETPPANVASDGEVAPSPMTDTDGRWATSRFVDPDDLRHDMHGKPATPAARGPSAACSTRTSTGTPG